MSNKWLSAEKPLIIGHRGASADAPENSLEAFQLALDQGADGIELDVQLSADGWPMVMHDFTVERTTDGAGNVSELTLAELQALKTSNGRAIPTLDDVFQLLGRRVLYNVEIKDMSWQERGLETAVAHRIRAFDLADQVLISSFNPLSLRRARRYLEPDTAVALLRAKGWLKYGYLLADGQADHPHYSMVDEQYMAWAKNRGYRVNVWTLDDPETARRLIDLGIHGIITNKPGWLRQQL